jgi:hypothetical protein
MTSPKWKCEKCNTFVKHLNYCSECWKLVCERCYDPIVGVCTACAKGIFSGEITQPLEVQSIKRCKKCGSVLAEAKNGKLKCPNCDKEDVKLKAEQTVFKSAPEHALVENRDAYSDLASSQVDEDEKDPMENLPDGYKEIFEPPDDERGT